MTFRSGREPATLDRFADPEFVASLSRAERKESEEVIASLLERMLKTRHIPRRIGRLRTNKEVSLQVLAARPPTSLTVALGSSRFTILESASWIGDSVAKLLMAAEPDPGMPAKRSSIDFRESEYELIGRQWAAPTAVQPPPLRRREPVDRKLTVSIEPREPSDQPAGEASLRIRAASGLTIAGNDLRLGWLLHEANKVRPLDGSYPIEADELIASLQGSDLPNAADLGQLLQQRLAEIEQASATEEIRQILSTMFVAAKKPDQWSEQSLHWAFGVGDASSPPFDPAFWGSGTESQKAAIKLRRRLQSMSALLATQTLYSPALEILRQAISGVRFIGARHLQARLGPILGKANVIGVMHFLTDMLDHRDGAMVSTLINRGTSRETDMFFWVPSSGDAFWAHAICMRAQDQTLAQGAFSTTAVLEGAKAELGSRTSELSVVKVKDCEDILNELSTVRWLPSKGWGVVQDATVLPAIVEEILAVAHPFALGISDAREALEWVLDNRVDVKAARQRLGVEGLAPPQVLLEALDSPTVRTEMAPKTLVARAAPPPAYWRSRPLEWLIIETLRAAGGSMLNRLLYRRLRDHKLYDSAFVTAASKTLPYLYAPTPLTTALRDWANG